MSKEVVDSGSHIIEAPSEDRSPLGDVLVGIAPTARTSSAAVNEVDQALTDEQVSPPTLVCDGESDWTISRRTGSSMRTVQRRIQDLRHLLQVESRAALAARAASLPPGPSQAIRDGARESLNPAPGPRRECI
jgi:hypothetical protein